MEHIGHVFVLTLWVVDLDLIKGRRPFALDDGCGHERRGVRARPRAVLCDARVVGTVLSVT